MEMCQPPRAVINRPKLRVPPLSCDCHAHILGPPSRFPYVPDRSYTPPDALPKTHGPAHVVTNEAVFCPLRGFDSEPERGVGSNKGEGKQTPYP